MSKEVAELSDWRLEMTRPDGSDGEGDDWDDDEVGATDGSGGRFGNDPAEDADESNAQDEEVALRQKYGLGPPQRERTHEPSGASSFSWGDASAAELQRLTSQNSVLLRKIAERDREVHRLEELVLAMEPPAGLDAGRLMEAQQGGRSDPRDSKILELAKRVRSLNVALGKERRARERADHSHSPLESPSRTATATAAAAAAAGAGGSDGSPSPRSGAASKQQIKALQQRLNASNRKVDELQASMRTYRQVLRREIGDDAAINAALDQCQSQEQDQTKQSQGGWRGRAQQIVMLKTKVKRLTNELRAVKPGGRSPSTPRDVDERATKRLEESAQARQESFEQLQQQNATLESEKATLARRVDALKARTSVMENETKELRQQTATLLQKSDLDDKLVDGLREERNQLQRRLAQLQRASTAPASPSRADFGGSNSISSSVKIGGMSTQQLREAREAVLAGEGSSSPISAVDLNRVLEDSERVVRLSKEQARRLDGQEKLLQSMKQEVARLREENAAFAQQRKQQQRPVSSADVWRAASNETERNELQQQVQRLQAENARMAELQRHTDRRVRDLEQQLESAIRRNHALERNGKELESRMNARQAGASVRPTSAAERTRLQAQLEQVQNEKDRLERYYKDALNARDQEIRLARPMSDTNGAPTAGSASASATASSAAPRPASRPSSRSQRPPRHKLSEAPSRLDAAGLPDDPAQAASPRRPDLSSPRAVDVVTGGNGHGDGDDGDSWGASDVGSDAPSESDVPAGGLDEWGDFGDMAGLGGARSMGSDLAEPEQAGTGEGKEETELRAYYQVKRNRSDQQRPALASRDRGSVRQELAAIRQRMAGSQGR